MICRYSASMDGVALDSLDPSILILDINYPETSPDFTFANNASGLGSRINRESFAKASVSITFQIRKYGIADRQSVLASIRKWARGSVLTVSDRPGQRLRCVCESFPSLSQKNWLEDLTMTFGGYIVPFWESTSYTSVTISGTEEEAILIVPGNAPFAYVELLASVSSSQTVTASFAAGNTSLTITGAALTASNPLEIAYDDNLIQSITAGDTSLLNKRSGADNLIAECGENTVVSFESNVALSVTFRARGLWI